MRRVEGLLQNHVILPGNGNATAAYVCACVPDYGQQLKRRRAACELEGQGKGQRRG